MNVASLNEMSEESWYGVCGVLAIIGVVGFLICIVFGAMSISNHAHAYDMQKERACVTAGMQWNKGNCVDLIPAPTK